MTRTVLWLMVILALTVLHPGLALVIAGFGLVGTVLRRKPKPTVEQRAKVIVDKLFAELRA